MILFYYYYYYYYYYFYYYYYYYYINIFLHDGEERAMHSKSDNIEIMISDEANEVINIFLTHLKTDIEII